LTGKLTNSLCISLTSLFRTCFKYHIYVIEVDIWWISGEYQFSWRLAELAELSQLHTIQP